MHANDTVDRRNPFFGNELVATQDREHFTRVGDLDMVRESFCRRARGACVAHAHKHDVVVADLSVERLGR